MKTKKKPNKKIKTDCGGRVNSTNPKVRVEYVDVPLIGFVVADKKLGSKVVWKKNKSIK